MKFKIGTYTKKVSQGVYTAELQDGKVVSTTLFQSLDNPTYIDQNGDLLFSVIKAGDQGGIALLKDGQVVNQAIETGAPPCYVSYDAKHGLIFSANYHGGRINSYSLDSHGRIQDLEKFSYGEGAKAHYVKYDPSLDEVLVCDLGSDKVYFYKVDGQRLHLAHTYHAPAKSGPRHLVVDPATKRIFLFTELSSELIVLKRTPEGTEVLQSLSTLPKDATTTKWGAAIRISPDGHFVYVSNRAHDSLSVFDVRNGAVSMVQNIPTYGVQPRDFNLSPDGSYVVVGNLDTNTLTTYARDAANGLLSLLEKDIPSFEPVCILFEE